MNVYWLLFIEDLSSAEILKRYKISKSSLYKCFSELDRLKLIIWKAGDKITASPKRPFLIKPTGPMMQLWIRHFSESIIEDFFLNQDEGKASDKEPYLTQRFLHLKSESILDLRQRLEALIKEFSLRSTREKSLSRSRTMTVRIFAACALGSMVKDLR